MRFQSIKLSELAKAGNFLGASYWVNTTKRTRKYFESLSEQSLDSYLECYKDLGPTASRAVKLHLSETFGKIFVRYFESFVEASFTHRTLPQKVMLCNALFSIREKIEKSLSKELDEMQVAVKKNISDIKKIFYKNT